MKLIPNSLSRLGYRQVLKIRKNSPTILVVSGVVGFGATAFLAAKATRNVDPILEKHAKKRIDIAIESGVQEERQEVVRLYAETSIELAKLYAPTVIVGTLSAVSVLHGHKILRTRHIATMAAYTGLLEQYNSYRARVAESLGSDFERDIYDGAVVKYEEDPDHPGEYKQKSRFDDLQAGTYLRPYFDESNDNWTKDARANYMFLKGVQSHMNDLLQIRGHVFLFEVYDALGMPRRSETIVTGWLYNGDGDGYVDFGFMTEKSPEAAKFRNHAERSVRLNFNIDGSIWDKI